MRVYVAVFVTCKEVRDTITKVLTEWVLWVSRNFLYLAVVEYNEVS